MSTSVSVCLKREREIDACRGERVMNVIKYSKIMNRYKERQSERKN